MSDENLDKTFVERSPASLGSPAFPIGGGHGIPLPNSHPIIGQTRFGSSVVTEIIGEGGMATVYKVWNERLEVFRAIKLLSHESFSARFETEAKITAKLHHDGIVEIHNIGEWNGLPYMEMEFVDGSDLQKTIAERGRLPEIVCIAIATLVAEALAHAHTKTFTLVGKQYCGIIHRDLKPANIMISTHGNVKLTDFGIARPAEASLHTIEGNIAGTMCYLSPEQMDGGEVDNRSDIYSFGTVLYEMVTGAKTFPQGSITELMKQRSANKFKSPDEYGFPINADLVRIILRCLKQAPTRRYQHTQDLVNDLQDLIEAQTKQTPKSILKNYCEGTENTVYTDPGQPKTRWLLDKLKMPGASAKSKTPEPAEKTETAELPDEQIPYVPVDEPIVAEPAETPKITEKPDKQNSLRTPSKPIAAKPVKKTKKMTIADKPKKATPVEKRKRVKTLDWPAVAEKLKSAWRSTISTKSRRTTLVFSLLLLTAFALSYITIRIITPKSSAEKSVTAKTWISAAATSDSAAVTKSMSADTTTATPQKAPPVVTAAPPPPTPVATPQPLRTHKVDTVATNTKTEQEHLREAISASNAKKWDQAIEILEQGGVYKELEYQRTLYLLNAYLESRQLDKAQVILDTTSFTLAQDAYFHLCTGKYWHYRGAPDKAIGYFESSLLRTSVIENANIFPYAALYFIADIKNERFKVTPSAFNRSAALEAWRDVQAAFASKPNDTRAKRAEREISVLSTGQSR